MDFEIIRVNSPEKWIESLNGIDHSYFHTWEYCNSLSKSNNQEIFLLVFNSKEYKLITTYSIREKLIGYKDIYSPYGFGGFLFAPKNKLSNESLPLDFQDFWNWFGNSNDFITSYISIHPCLPAPFSLHNLLTKHHTVYNLNLNLSKEEIWNNLQRGHRYEINKSYKDLNFNIIKDKVVLFPKFIELYFKTLNRVEASEVYYFKEDFLKAITFSENSILIGAEKDGEIVAIVLFLYNGNIGEYFISSAIDNYRIFTRVLIWEGIVDLKEKEVETLNLGGGINENDTLDAFKRRFGGSPTSLYVHKHIFNQDKFKELCDKFEVNPNSSNYFPPYWKKN